MESFETILVVLGCVLIASVFDQLFSRVTIPLVQIAVGVVAGIFVTDDPTAIFSDPDLFLLIFIAPLLFSEAMDTDKETLWRNKATVLSLAIGLVLVTCLVVGFVLHLIVPSIPLAAAFALGAALAPTDAASVLALGKDVNLSKNQESILSGEAMVNDASGVVSFDFAIAAAVTGTFSMAEATVSFLYEFFGGIIVGLLLGAVIMFILNRVLTIGLETPTVYVLVEVCTPLFAFLLGDALGVSGILSVIAAGLTMKFYPNNLTEQSSRYAIASKNVWDFIKYVINGFVFVILGMKLPDVFLPTWNESGAAGGFYLIGLVLLLTALLLGLRFVWILAMDSFSIRYGKRKAEKRRFDKTLVREALTMTLSGTKGAITLSIVLSIPYYLASGDPFPNRDMLIFLASGVIVCTLLISSFVVPVLSPAEEDEEREREKSEAEIQILQNVIDALIAKKTPENESAVLATVASYRSRINLIKEESLSDDLTHDLRLYVLDEQLDYIRGEVEDGKVRRSIGEEYASVLNRWITTLEKSSKSWRTAPSKRIRTPVSWYIRYALRKTFGRKETSEEDKKELAGLMERSEKHCLEYIKELSEGLDEEGKRAMSIVRSEHVSALRALGIKDPEEVYTEGLAMQPSAAAQDGRPSLTAAFQSVNEVRTMQRNIESMALSMELEQIQLMREEGRISTGMARELRNEVYVLQMGLEAR